MKIPRINIIINFKNTKLYKRTFLKRTFGIIPQACLGYYYNKRKTPKIETYLESHPKTFKEFVIDFSDTITHELIHFNILNENIIKPSNKEHKIMKQMGLNI